MQNFSEISFEQLENILAFFIQPNVFMVNLNELNLLKSLISFIFKKNKKKLILFLYYARKIESVYYHN